MARRKKPNNVVRIDKKTKKSVERRFAGYLMEPIAIAIWEKYDYGQTVTEDELVQILADHDRIRPRGSAFTQWINNERYHINDFGSNVDLLTKAGITEFQLTRQPAGRSYTFCTNGQDLLIRDRPRECALKELRSIKAHAKRQAFITDDGLLRYCNRITRRSGEVTRFLSALEVERNALARTENDKAEKFNISKRKPKLASS